MDSVHAQCLLTDLVGAEMPAPDLWRHGRTGELSCAFASGEREFTWPVEDVADMARRWREMGEREAPESLRTILEVHRRFEELVSTASWPSADTVIHDLERRELRFAWESPKLVVVLDL